MRAARVGLASKERLEGLPAGRQLRQRRPRRLPETETQKAALAAFDARIGQSYGDGPTARLRRRSEPSFSSPLWIPAGEPAARPS